ncbi:MAG: hypothetical protein K6T17_03100 [Fimbriimonadales bacterium]|nr:hypothetical protein [Fimbriimonadales bacterium]
MPPDTRLHFSRSRFWIPRVLVLHLYAQPDDSGYLAAQQPFANTHPWFQVLKLEARGHFPMYEVPGEMAMAIERFVQA